MLLWTIQVPDDAVVIDLNAGTAQFNLHNTCVHDVFTVPNSFDITHALGFVRGGDPVAADSVERRHSVFFELLEQCGTVRRRFLPDFRHYCGYDQYTRDQPAIHTECAEWVPIRGGSDNYRHKFRADRKGT